MLILHIYVSRVFNRNTLHVSRVFKQKIFEKSSSRGPIFPNAKKVTCKKLLLHIIWEIMTERLFSPNEIRDNIRVLGLLNLRVLKSQIIRVNYFSISQIQRFLYPQLIHHFILCGHKMFSRGFNSLVHRIFLLLVLRAALCGAEHHCISF